MNEIEKVKSSTLDEPPSRQERLDRLKERCLNFGVDATKAELIDAGLLLLETQTETALEAAILQSLRADRSFMRRKTRRK